MRIAFCVEGSADRAILHGLRDRWCKDAELVEGRFRGQLPRSQVPKECKILAQKGADLIVFLRDSNREDWREVLKSDEAKCPPEYRHKVVFGVCDRNAECWLAAAPDHLSSEILCIRKDLDLSDPSPVVKKGFGLIGFDKAGQEPRVAKYVRSAPLKLWLQNKSFEHFYLQLWHFSKQRDCLMENLQ